MKCNLVLLKKADPEPSEEEIEDMLDFMVHNELYDLAGQIETARAYWRRHRDLVEAPEFHELLRAHFIEEYDAEPDDNFSNSPNEVNALDPNLREILRPKAIEWLQHKKEREARRV